MNILKALKISLSISLVFWLISCSNSYIDDARGTSVNYSFQIFPDYNKKGVYLTDPRYLYKNILYHFDFENEQWTAVADGNGLPEVFRYLTYSFNAAYSISPDSIMAIEGPRVFLRNVDENFWKSIEIENFNNYLSESRFGNHFYGLNTFTFNEFDKLVYSFAYNKKDILFLGKDYNWYNKVSLPYDEKYTLKYAAFVDKDDLIMVNAVESGLYSDTVSIALNNLNVSTGEYKLIKSFDYKLKINVNEGYVSDLYYFLLNGDLYLYGFRNYVNYHPWVNERQNDVFFTKIPLNNEMASQCDSFEYYINKNPENINQWGEIDYEIFNTLKVYYFNNNFYLFINEFPYKYSTETKQWTALQPCPFNTLNKNL